MRPTQNYILSGLVVLFLLASCGLEPGKGWTRVELTPSVQWNAEGRLENDGRFKTSKSYLIDFESLEVKVGGVAFEAVSSDVGGDFDPSNPPDGYTLCHNGHCHNEADELIDYETILLEMGASSAGAKVVEQVIEQTVAVDTSSTSSEHALRAGACNDGGNRCELGPDNLRSVKVGLNGLYVKMRVYHGEKLPAEGIAVELAMTTPVQLEKYFPLTLGTDAKQVLRLKMALIVEPGIWDYIDFEEFVLQEGGLDLSALTQKLEQALRHAAIVELVNSEI